MVNGALQVHLWVHRNILEVFIKQTANRTQAEVSRTMGTGLIVTHACVQLSFASILLHAFGSAGSAPEPTS